jgi:hypothetical protein
VSLHRCVVDAAVTRTHRQRAINQQRHLAMQRDNRHARASTRGRDRGRGSQHECGCAGAGASATLPTDDTDRSGCWG